MEDIINSLKDDAKYLLELAKFNKIKTKIEIDLLKNIEFSEELIKKIDGARDKVDVFLDKMAYIKKSIRDTAKISERFNQVKFGRMISDARNEERKIRDLLNQIDNEILNFGNSLCTAEFTKKSIVRCFYFLVCSIDNFCVFICFKLCHFFKELLV